MTDFFTEVEWLLHDKPVRSYNYYYDQIVCVGELLSTSIVSSFLLKEGVLNHWVDVRDIFATDEQFRAANIDWGKTSVRFSELILPLFSESNIILTQGFIGSTDANESTTLGREGSDYSAAIFANLMEADALTIWKDVEGVMNADPKAFPNAQYIRELGYDEVIEMAFYGAQVIHPKTIKPLQNKNIPLQVKCFLDPNLPGHTHTFKTYFQFATYYCFKTKSGAHSFEVQGFFLCGRRRRSSIVQNTFLPSYPGQPASVRRRHFTSMCG